MRAWPEVPEPAAPDVSEVVLESVEEEEAGWVEVAGEFAVAVAWSAGGGP